MCSYSPRPSAAARVLQSRHGAHTDHAPCRLRGPCGGACLQGLARRQRARACVCVHCPGVLERAAGFVLFHPALEDAAGSCTVPPLATLHCATLSKPLLCASFCTVHPLASLCSFLSFPRKNQYVRGSLVSQQATCSLPGAPSH